MHRCCHAFSFTQKHAIAIGMTSIQFSIQRNHFFSLLSKHILYAANLLIKLPHNCAEMRKRLLLVGSLNDITEPLDCDWLQKFPTSTSHDAILIT